MKLIFSGWQFVISRHVKFSYLSDIQHAVELNDITYTIESKFI